MRAYALAGAILACASGARADDANYRPYVVGGRAAGMGGAFTALADDGSAPYYNPGGLAFVRKSQLSLSGSVYGLVSGRQADALGDGHDFTFRDLNIFPVSTSAVWKLADGGSPDSDGTAWSVRSACAGTRPTSCIWGSPPTRRRSDGDRGDRSLASRPGNGPVAEQPEFLGSEADLVEPAPRLSVPRLRVRVLIAALFDLLGEVVLLADLSEEVLLRLEPVHVLFLVDQHVLEELAAAGIVLVPAELDAFVDALHRVVLDGEVELELLRHGLADVDLPELLKIRQSFEEEDARDQLVRVLHLLRSEERRVGNECRAR